MSERVHGPYKHGKRWRCFNVRGDGTRTVVTFETEAEGHKYVAACHKVAVGRTVGEAVSEYLEHLKEAPGRGGRARRESTVKLESWRLRAFLRLASVDPVLGSLTKVRCRGLFEQRKAEVKVDTLVGELTTVSRACRWFVAQGWLGADPCAGLVVGGERSAGKPQLRVDEARRYLNVALTEGTEGLAAAMAILMGMRASEITGLTVRDVDDGGRLVWITHAKTRRGVRRLEVPGVLVPRLVELCAARPPEARLWGDVDRHWLYYHVPRIAMIAGLPRITPHGLRGTWATLAMGAMPTEQVAAALGHRPEVTRTNYAAPGSEQSGQSMRVAAELETPPSQKFPDPAPPAENTLN